MTEKWNQMDLIATYSQLMTDDYRYDRKYYGTIGQFLFEVRDYVHAVEYLSRAIEVNDASAYFYLGLCCKYSLGVKGRMDDASQMFSCWRHADEKQKNYIWEAYLTLCDYGNGQSPEHALQVLKRSAKSRNADACRLLGNLYMGRIAEGYLDYELAEKYLEVASEENDVNAAYDLSYLYQFIENGSYIEDAQAAYGYVTGQYMRVKEKYPSEDAYRHLMEHYERGCVGLSKEHYEHLAEECRIWLEKNTEKIK